MAQTTTLNHLTTNENQDDRLTSKKFEKLEYLIAIGYLSSAKVGEYNWS